MGFGKRLLSLLLALVFVCAAVPEVDVGAAKYYINGQTVSNDDFPSSPDECWVYAQNVYKKIWNATFSVYFSDADNSLRELPQEELTLTREHLEAYVTNAELGSVLRICNEKYLYSHDGWGHSQIIVQKDANGFTVFEGGLSASPYRREHYYTWDEYINTNWLGGNYKYIKYIKWPGATPYQNNSLVKKTYSTHCEIQAIGNTSLMSLPCSSGTDAASEKIRSVKEGEKLTATALILNNQGNHWYCVTTGDGGKAYIPSAQAKYIKDITSGFGIDGVSAPETLTAGSSYSIKGIVRSDVVDLIRVAAYVYSGTEIVGDPVTGGSMASSGKQRSLENSAVDNNCVFGALKPGTYTYAVYAHAMNYYALDEKTATSKEVICCVYKKTFTVVEKVATECSHSYSETLTTAPTCVTPGLKTFRCTKCQNTYTKTVPTVEHNYGGWVVSIRPSCVEAGEEKSVCVGCGDEKLRPVPAKGHDYSSQMIPATCVEGAKIKYTCKTCQHSYTAYGGDPNAEWQASIPSGVDPALLETKTQYRYRTYMYSTGINPNPAGWEVYGQEEGTGDYGDWSDWSDTKTEQSESVQVETRTVYGYYYFQCPACGAHMHGWGITCPTWAGGCGRATVPQSSWVAIWSPISWDDAGLEDFYGTGKYSTTIGNQRVFKWNDGGTKTQWRFRERNAETIYYYRTWSEWSEWSDTKHIASAEVEVQTRVLYRLKNAALGGHQWDSGKITVAPACETTGAKTFTCTVCKTTRSEAIPATGHSVGNDGSCSLCGKQIVELGTMKIRVENATVSAGSAVTVAVLVEQNEGFTYLKLGLEYDDTLELVSVSNGTLIDSLTQGKYYVWSASDNQTADGVLAYLTFRVKEGAEDGDYTVGVHCLECSNEDEMDVSVIEAPGCITVKSYQYGDANGDREIDGKDATRLRRYLANYDEIDGTCDVEITEGADVNGDGEINGKDLTRLLRYLANFDDETGESTIPLGPSK
ncbi:MAG: hypothetical protein E7651_08820 [Ruminococcaceae bacterium]|nr:hypothetical protein [Oscillospiraceae bacterium]